MSERTKSTLRCRLAIEPLEKRCLLTVLFSETFPTPSFEPAHWDVIEQSKITAGHENLPSDPFAAVLSGGAQQGDQLRSVSLDLSGQTTATISYFFRRATGVAAPLADEDLVLEIRTENGPWTEIDRQLGGLPASQSFTRRDTVVDLVALGASETDRPIQFRLRNLGNRAGAGQWLLDDIQLRTGTSAITGHLRYDTNGDGEANLNELPLAGWTVYVDANDNRLHDANELSSQTDVTGLYTIDQLPPGEYRLRQSPPSGWQQTSTTGGALRFDVDASLIDSTTDWSGVRSIAISGEDAASGDWFAYVAVEGSNTINVLRHHNAHNTLEPVQTLQDDVDGPTMVSNTAMLALSTDEQHLYAISGLDNRLSLFARNPLDGTVEWIANNRPGIDSTEGLEFPTALAVSSDDQHLYVTSANPGGVALFDRNATNGELSFVELYKNIGGQIDGLAGAQSLVLSPDGGHLYVAGTSENAIAVFSREASTGQLTFVESIHDNSIGLDARLIDGLGGVRSLSISPDGRHLYAASSFDDAIATFARDTSTGRLGFVHSLQDGTNGLENLDGAYTVEVDRATGLYVYVGALNDDAITVFRRDPDRGVLTPLKTRRNGQDDVVGLDSPRTLATNADGTSLLTAGFFDSGIATFDTRTTTQTITMTNDQPITGVDFAIGRLSTDWQQTAGESLWSAPDNWTGGAAPLSGDLLRFQGLSEGPIQNDFAEGTIFRGLLLDGDDFDIGGNPITLSAAQVSTIENRSGANHVSLPIDFTSPAEIYVAGDRLELTGILNPQDQPISVQVDQDAELLVTSRLLGSGDLVKQGVGKMTIGAADNYHGAVQVEEGELSILGLFASELGLHVRSGAVLSGNGTLVGPVQVDTNGSLAPGGESAATLNVGPLTMEADAQLQLQLNGPDAGQYDLLRVTGEVDLTDAVLSATLGYHPEAGDLLVIIANDGIDPIQGTFKDFPEGASLSVGDVQFNITYRGGDGNDVALQLPLSGTVSGLAWNDINSNGTRDEGEPTLVGQTVYVDLNDSGNFDLGDPTSQTDDDGVFVITGVPEGTHRIAQRLSNGWQQTAPQPGQQSLALLQSYQDEVQGVTGLDGVRALAISPDDQHLYTAANNDDSVAVFRRNGDGTLAFVESLSDGDDSVDGLNGARTVAVSPDGKHLYVGGYYDDAIALFQRDAETGELSWLEQLKNGDELDGDLEGEHLTGLNGITSIVVAPDIFGNSYVFAAGYLDDSIAAFSRDSETGLLTFIQSVRDGQNLIDGLDGVSQLVVSPDAKHLYAAGTNDNAIAVFSIDPSSGSLTFIHRIESGSGGASGLQIIRSLAISPDGKHFYTASEFENSIAQFSRDAQTGQLRFVDAYQNGQLGITGLLGVTSVTVTSDGLRVFAAAAESEAVVMFDRNPNTGSLSMAGFFDDGSALAGAWAIATVPGVDEYYVAGQDADTVAVFGLALPNDHVSVVAGRTTDAGKLGSHRLISEITVRGSQWSPDFLSHLAAADLGESGMTVWSEVMDSPSVVPIGGVDVIEIQFSDTLTPQSSDLSIRGAVAGVLPIIALSVNTDAQTATWQFEEVSGAERLRFSLFDDILLLNVSVLPGDVTQDSIVDIADLRVALVSQFFHSEDVAYNPRSDINTDGLVDLSDLLSIRRQVGSTLPVADNNELDHAPTLLYASTEGPSQIANRISRSLASGSPRGSRSRLGQSKKSQSSVALNIASNSGCHRFVDAPILRSSRHSARATVRQVTREQATDILFGDERFYFDAFRNR